HTYVLRLGSRFSATCASLPLFCSCSFHFSCHPFHSLSFPPRRSSDLIRADKVCFVIPKSLAHSDNECLSPLYSIIRAFGLYWYLSSGATKTKLPGSKSFSVSNRSITSPSLYLSVFTHYANLTMYLSHLQYSLIPLPPMYLYEDYEGILQALLIRNHSLYNFVL